MFLEHGQISAGQGESEYYSIALKTMFLEPGQISARQGESEYYSAAFFTKFLEQDKLLVTYFFATS